MVCLLKEQLVVLGGVTLKLEEFEGAASEKDGDSGRAGHCFFAEKIPLVPLAPKTLQKVMVCVGVGEKGEGGSLFFA